MSTQFDDDLDELATPSLDELLDELMDELLDELLDALERDKARASLARAKRNHRQSHGLQRALS